jgi:hypothetical protein
MDEKAIRALLGIDEEADIGGAIGALQTTIVAQKAVIETDQPTADKAAYAAVRNDLATAQRAALTVESTMNQRIAALEEERRTEKAEHKVESLVMRGKIKPSQREFALNLALTMPPDKFDEFTATLQGVDLVERGVASGSEMAEFEPTQTEAAIARNMGKDPSSKEWRLGIMQQKAKAKGLTLPAEVA